MSNDNCRECLKISSYVCIRAILARFLRNPLLLAHKGIELSDLQGEAALVDGSVLRIWSFAKLAAPRKTLTARNDEGAILQAQIIPQLAKTSFDTVLVLTPSQIEEDLRDSLFFLCSLTGKRLIFVDREPLSKMLLEYERQVQFDGCDLKAIYSASNPPKKTKKRKK